jgi:hypothetical protein
LRRTSQEAQIVATRSQIAVYFALLAGLSFTAPAGAQDRARALGSPTYGTIPPWNATTVAIAPVAPPSIDPTWQTWDPAYAMARAEQHGTPGGDRVLSAARTMIDEGAIVRGSCYDWVDAVFTRASGHRHDAFHGSIAHGPYAQVQDFQPGDWVLFVHSEYEGEAQTHSAIFVGWADESARVAVMMSYPGQRRDEPGRYGTYVLTRAYRIIRLSDEPAAPSRPHRAHASRAHRSRAAS